MSEKEKLLVMSNFSFSHSVFKRLVSQGRQKVSLCGNGLNQLYGMSHALWKGDLMHLPKGIDPYQPAQSAPSSQAKMSLRRLTVMLPLNFLHVNPFQNCILDPSKLRTLKTTISTSMKVTEVLLKGRKCCGKSKNCLLQVIPPFTTVFSKDLYRRHVKTRACFGKG